MWWIGVHRKTSIRRHYWGLACNVSDYGGAYTGPPNCRGMRRPRYARYLVDGCNPMPLLRSEGQILDAAYPRYHQSQLYHSRKWLGRRATERSLHVPNDGNRRLCVHFCLLAKYPHEKAGRHDPRKWKAFRAERQPP